MNEKPVAIGYLERLQLITNARADKSPYQSLLKRMVSKWLLSARDLQDYRLQVIWRNMDMT